MFLIRTSPTLGSTFCLIPPKTLCPSHTMANNRNRTCIRPKAMCACLHTNAPLPFATKVLSTLQHAHSRSGIWAGSRRGAGPIVQHLQEPFVRKACCLPMPCCAGTVPEQCCPHLLPHLLHGIGNTTTSKQRAQPCPKNLLYSILLAELGR